MNHRVRLESDSRLLDERFAHSSRGTAGARGPFAHLHGRRCALTLVIALLLLTERSADGATRLSKEPLRSAVAWQIALDRAGISAGVIDGKLGRKTEIAIREFQRLRNLPQTGKPDAATATTLGVAPDAAFTSYVVQPRDAEGVRPVPKDWNERARMSHMGYESAAAAVAERFHCSRGLLASLNPGVDLATLRPGMTLTVPNVMDDSPKRAAAWLYIDLSEKVVRALDAEKRVIALFHCSVAEKREKLPTRDARVAELAHRPTYLFDPRMWPEVKNVRKKLLIPPGPRNPVGMCWIGLDLPGYGIHGTPAPEMIGKTGSHGCFRLTNWDAERLGRMVTVGTPVRFFSRAGDALAQAKE